MARKRISPPDSILGWPEAEAAHIPLDRVRILQTALQVLDEIGLKELSMRKIADKLQVKTASLYYHFRDKEQLMQLLSDKISGEMVWPEASLPWKEQVLQWGIQFRKVLLQHRDAVELFNLTIGVGYQRLTQIEKLYQLFVSAGFADPQIPWIASMLKNYVLGFVAEETRLHAFAGEEDHASFEAMGEQYSRFFRQLPEEHFPNTIRLAPHITNTDWEKEFSFGLSVLIEGFSTKLPQE
ncbi:hypothetical protein QJ48_15125 [Paenibacillus sp. A3]|uniref:TetR/AcrR family transcriptional regulator n=1 Tax=Paenibacillus sp. A3 TaxID=1337054 RepID=UPI0006D57E86|nr:TetR/AcrR family transcriptional regulator [Paenibacillus sp. A3]KPV58702.1 hypothetical protein QJ48_15125 [Paenibacillus sp. A3]